MKLYQVQAEYSIEYSETVVSADARGIRRGQVPESVIIYAERWAKSIAVGHDTVRVTVCDYTPPIIGRDGAGLWGVSQALASWVVECPRY